MNPNCKNKIGENGVEKTENSSSGGSRLLHDFKFDHFTSLSRREQ